MSSVSGFRIALCLLLVVLLAAPTSLAGFDSAGVAFDAPESGAHGDRVSIQLNFEAEYTIEESDEVVKFRFTLGSDEASSGGHSWSGCAAMRADGIGNTAPHVITFTAERYESANGRGCVGELDTQQEHGGGLVFTPGTQWQIRGQLAVSVQLHCPGSEDCSETWSSTYHNPGTNVGPTHTIGVTAGGTTGGGPLFDVDCSTIC